MADLEKETEKLRKELLEHQKMWKKFGIAFEESTEDILDANELFKESMAKLTDVAVTGVIRGFMSAAKSAMASGDAFAMAASVMESNLDMLSSGIQVGSKSMVDAGKQMVESGQKYGMTTMIAGQAVGALTGAIVELAKAGIQFMLGQVKQMVAGFQQLSQAGAVFGGSMQDMSNIALQGGLTMEQFGKAVSDNKAALISSGMGVTEASVKMTKAMKAGGEQARQGMFGLGMTMDEQAEAYAQTMAKLAGPAGKLHASDEEVAQQTQSYARDLKLISDLTGKSAKEMEAQSEALKNNGRMQQELMKMAPEARIAFDKAFKAMDETSQKSIQDRIAHAGAVTDKTTAVLESVSPALRAMHEEEYRLAKAGKLNADTELELRAKYQTSIKEQLANQTALGTAAASQGSNIADVNNALGQLLSEATVTEEERQKRAAEIDKAQKGPKGAGSAAGLMELQQQNAVKLQQIANQHLGEFGNALDATVKQMQGAVEVMAHGGIELATFFSGWTGLLTSALLSIAGGAFQAYIAKKALGGAGEAAAKGVGGAAEKAATSGMGKALGEVEEIAGKGGGGGMAATLTSLAEGLAAFCNPLTLVGLAAVTAATIGFAYALQLAAPGIEAIGKALGTFVESVGTAVATVFKGLSEGLIAITNNVDPLKLLALVPGIAGIGFALLPFGVGGALAGIVGAGGGFDSVVEGIQKFETLDPDRLTAVAGAMKQINDNMPSVTDLLKFDALHAVESVFGGKKDSSSSSTSTAGLTPKEDPMSKLVSLTEQTISNQKEMLRYLRDGAHSSEKIFKAVS